MTDPHTYFREATATLAPDVEALVAGGIDRGRTRRRRRTTLAAVAAGAAVAVVAVAAVSVPRLVGAQPTQISPAGPGPAEKSAAADDQARQQRTNQPSPAHPRELAVRPDDFPQAFVWIVGGTATAEQTYPSDHGGVVTNFLWNGAYTTFILDRVATERTPLEECRHLARQASAHPTCEQRPDGSVGFTWQERQPMVDGGVTGRGYTLCATDGWQVDVISYNAATPKATEYVSPEPPLSFDQMQQVATSDDWFAKR